MFKNVVKLLVLSLLVSCSNPTEKPTAATEPAPQEDTVAVQKSEPANTRYKAGDQLTAFALAGLTLRDKPDKQGAKLANIPLGTAVKVLPDDLFKIPFSVSEKNNVKLNGFWVKVSANGKEGYVFDGFLSHLSVPGKSDPLTYLSKWSKKVSTSKTPPPKKEDQDASIFEYELTKFENGTSYEMSAYEGGATTLINIPTNLATFEEAFTLGKAFFPPANDESDEYTALDIKKEGNYYIIQFAVAD